SRRKPDRHSGETAGWQDAVDPFGDRSFGHATQPQPEGNVVEHRQMREQRVILEYEPDIAAMRRLVVEALATHPDRPATQRLKPGDTAQGRRLAAAARPKQREKFALMDLERD